jgi:hypothetical protein
MIVKRFGNLARKRRCAAMIAVSSPGCVDAAAMTGRVPIISLIRRRTSSSTGGAGQQRRDGARHHPPAAERTLGKTAVDDDHRDLAVGA